MRNRIFNCYGFGGIISLLDDNSATFAKHFFVFWNKDKWQTCCRAVQTLILRPNIKLFVIVFDTAVFNH